MAENEGAFPLNSQGIETQRNQSEALMGRKKFLPNRQKSLSLLCGGGHLQAVMVVFCVRYVVCPPQVGEIDRQHIAISSGKACKRIPKLNGTLNESAAKQSVAKFEPPKCSHRQPPSEWVTASKLVSLKVGTHKWGGRRRPCLYRPSPPAASETSRQASHPYVHFTQGAPPRRGGGGWQAVWVCGSVFFQSGELDGGSLAHRHNTCVTPPPGG